MATDRPLPGTLQHQNLLGLIREVYAGDDRVLALVLFGSLGRGAGDGWSDLDLAVIVRDGVQVDVSAELERLTAVLAAHGDPVLSTADAGDAGYLIPQSLCGIAIDYTELSKVSPYVVDGCVVLAGTLDLETIRKAAAANDKPPPPIDLLLQKALWLALGADITIQRRQFWQAVFKLESVRRALIEIYAYSRGGTRSAQVFAETAGADLQAKFGRTLPAFVPHSREGSVAACIVALSALLDLLEHDLAELSNGQLQLGPDGRTIIARLRDRLAEIDG